MANLALTTFDWVPQAPRDYVRDLRVRWALEGAFSVADILMVDVLRLVDRFDGLAEHPACHGYVERATARPSFVKAHADQIAHFAAAD